MSDDVDRIVKAWQGERPDLDFAPLEVLSRVTRLATHLERSRMVVFALHNLEAWMFDVLAALRRCGAPYELSPGQLVAQTLVTSGTMTNRLDRLEALGYLTRSPDPADGRGVRVRLTGAGAERADAAIGSLLEREEAILGSLTVRQRSQLGTLLRHVVAPFDA